MAPTPDNSSATSPVIISNVFRESLAKLTGREQKAVEAAAADLQANPAHPSLQFHRLEKGTDRRLWSARVSGKVRLIISRSDTGLQLCYVGHHEKAYHWAERRHPANV